MSRYLKDCVAKLKGLTVVVTRPRAQGEITAQSLEAAGAKTITYPVLDIQPLPADEIERRSTDSTANLANTTAIIFISANAVAYGMPTLQRWRGFPASGTLFGIGKITADALKNATVFDDHWLARWQTGAPSSGNDSEALLAMPSLQEVAGQHIIIVCGHSETGGRKVLQQTLCERGATVSLLVCYERKAISVSSAEQSALRAQLQSQSPTVFLALSVETLDSLMDNVAKLADANIVLRCTLLVSHPRVAEAARQRGWHHCAVVPMNDAALADAISGIAGMEGMAGMAGQTPPLL